MNGGGVWCWGTTAYNEIIPVGPNQGYPSNRTNYPIAYTSWSKPVTEVAVGNPFLCALLTDATVECVGYGEGGALGNGTFNNSITAVAVQGLINVASVNAGFRTVCAVLLDGSVKCWGEDGVGLLGDGGVTHISNIPKAVSLGGGVIASAVTVGPNNACALISNGTIKCWGYNSTGALGNGTTSPSIRAPTLVSNISSATSVDTSSHNSCATMADHSIQCWGTNSGGVLGNNSTGNTSSPVTVQDGSAGIWPQSGAGASAISLGGTQACALRTDGGMVCWGAGVKGNGSAFTADLTPVVVTAISSAVQIANGSLGACALLSNNTIKCWGENLGNGSRNNNSQVTAAELKYDEAITLKLRVDNAYPTIRICTGASVYAESATGASYVASDLAITLSAINAGGGSSTTAIFSDNECNVPTTAVTLQKGNNSTKFYYKNELAENTNLHAVAAANPPANPSDFSVFFQEPNCESIYSSESCDVFPDYCYYSPTLSTCGPACPRIYDDNTCNATDHCHWEDFDYACHDYVSCNQILDQYECYNSNLSCSWDGSSCY